MHPRLLAALASVVAATTATTTTWSCTAHPPAAPLPLPAGLSFSQLVCSSSAIPVFGKAGPLNVSVLSADLASGKLRLVPLTNASLATVGAMAAASPGRKLWGGINGGYFWRTDVHSFVDTVCLGKSRAQAEAAPSASAPNAGVGDGAVFSGGQLLASNCDCAGFSRPALLTINGSLSRVDVLRRGDAPPFGPALDAIAAGPNLVASNASGAFIAIPSDDDNIGVRWGSARPAARPAACAPVVKEASALAPHPRQPSSHTPLHPRRTSLSTVQTRRWGSFATGPPYWSPRMASMAARGLTPRAGPMRSPWRT